MKPQHNGSAEPCPLSPQSLHRQAQQDFHQLLQLAQQSDHSFVDFQNRLVRLMAALGRTLIGLFLASRHQRLDIRAFLQQGTYRAGKPDCQRTLHTRYGPVVYQRQHLRSAQRREGIFPFDIVLGLTNDQLTPWVIGFVAQLATRMSFSAARSICHVAIGWAPACSTIEQAVLGLGVRRATPGTAARWRHFGH